MGALPNRTILESQVSEGHGNVINITSYSLKYFIQDLQLLGGGGVLQVFVLQLLRGILQKKHAPHVGFLRWPISATRVPYKMYSYSMEDV